MIFPWDIGCDEARGGAERVLGTRRRSGRAESSSRRAQDRAAEAARRPGSRDHAVTLPKAQDRMHASSLIFVGTPGWRSAISQSGIPHAYSETNMAAPRAT